jgi:hypothetical protein
MAAPFATSTTATTRKISSLPYRVTAKSHARGIAFLGIGVRATTFVARLAIIDFSCNAVHGGLNQSFLKSIANAICFEILLAVMQHHP